MPAELPRRSDISSHLERIRSLTDELLRSQRQARSSVTAKLAERIRQEIESARALLQKPQK